MSPHARTAGNYSQCPGATSLAPAAPRAGIETLSPFAPAYAAIQILGGVESIPACGTVVVGAGIALESLLYPLPTVEGGYLRFCGLTLTPTWGFDYLFISIL